MSSCDRKKRITGSLNPEHAVLSACDYKAFLRQFYYGRAFYRTPRYRGVVSLFTARKMNAHTIHSCAIRMTEAFAKCWAHLPLRAAARPFTRCRCRTPPAHRCPRRQRQRQQRQLVTEGTAMAPWNGPNNNMIMMMVVIVIITSDQIILTKGRTTGGQAYFSHGGKFNATVDCMRSSR